MQLVPFFFVLDDCSLLKYKHLCFILDVTRKRRDKYLKIMHQICDAPTLHGHETKSTAIFNCFIYSFRQGLQLIFIFCVETSVLPSHSIIALIWLKCTELSPPIRI